MVTHNLTLPDHAEPQRTPVLSRYIGPTLAALRRHTGYRFIVETDRNGETHAWIERAARRRV